MKQLLALFLCAASLSGCCDMAYGPTQCSLQDAQNPAPVPVPAPMQLMSGQPAPVAAFEPLAVPPQDLIPAAGPATAPLLAPSAPAVVTPAIVQAPFMMSPSINGLDKSAPTSHKPEASAIAPIKTAPPAKADWLHM